MHQEEDIVLVFDCSITNYHKFSSLEQYAFIIVQFMRVKILGIVYYVGVSSASDLLKGYSQGVGKGWGFILSLEWGRICI